MLEELVQPVLDWVAAHPRWVGSLVFVVAAWESMIVLGMLVPGAMLMFAFGALIGLGYLDFWSACVWAACGAVVGDAFSYWAGHYFKDRLVRIWPLSRYPGMLDQGTAFFRKHGGKSVVFARFFGPLRGAVPAVAGMLGMSLWRFMLINLISAILWAPFTLMLGMVFAASLELAAQVAWRLMVLLLVLAVVLYVSWQLALAVMRFLQPRAGRWLARLVRWSEGRRLMGPLMVSLLVPGEKEFRGIVIVALVLLSGAVLVQLGGIAVNETLPTALDRAVFLFLQDLRTPQADRLLLVVSDLGGFQVLIPLTATVGLYLLARHNLLALGHWLLAIGAGLVFFNAFKFLFQVERPSPALITFSFPSGHATMSVVAYGFLAVLVARDTAQQWRWVPYGIATLLAVGIGFTRIYLGVHWLTDVVAGWCLGLLWVVLLGVTYRTRPAPDVGRMLLLGVTGPALALIVAVMAGDVQERLTRYRPAPVLARVEEPVWWGSAWQSLPALLQEEEDRRLLTLQYAGDLETLVTGLWRHGWQSAQPLNLSGMLYFLSPEVNLSSLPVLPQVRGGRDEALTLIRPDGEQRRWVLRFWDAGVRLTDDRPLWVGSLQLQRLSRRLDFLTLTVPAVDVPVPPSLLNPALASLHCRRLGTTDPPTLLVSDRHLETGENRENDSC